MTGMTKVRFAAKHPRQTTRRIGTSLGYGIRARLRLYLAPDEVVHRPGSLLSFSPSSYAPPTLLAFGREPNTGRVSVGKYSSINGGTRVILGGEHRSDWISTFPFRIQHGLEGAHEDGQPFSRGPVSIGSDVWVGYDVVIASGVNIGHGAIVATGSLVTRDVPPYTVVGGNPAKVIRPRFSEAQIAALLRIAWWDWPERTILERVDMLSSDAVERFIERFDTGAQGS